MYTIIEYTFGCVDDKLQGERDKITKLIDLKPSSFEFVILETISILEEIAQNEKMKWGE